MTKEGTSLEMQEVKDLVLKAAPAFMHPRMVWFRMRYHLPGQERSTEKCSKVGRNRLLRKANEVDHFVCNAVVSRRYGLFREFARRQTSFWWRS